MSDHPDTILLEGIQVPAALGVTAAERKMRRPVRLDLEIETDLRAAGRSDRIQQTTRSTSWSRRWGNGLPTPCSTNSAWTP